MTSYFQDGPHDVILRRMSAASARRLLHPPAVAYAATSTGLPTSNSTLQFLIHSTFIYLLLSRLSSSGTGYGFPVMSNSISTSRPVKYFIWNCTRAK